MTNATEVLSEFNIGNSVAEFDEKLDKYFFETDTFRSVIRSEFDVIAGDKGTGKTAIYRVLKRSYRHYSELESVEIVDAFNVQGNPIFQRLLRAPALSEGQYRTFWKAYIFSLLGNYLIDIYGPEYNEDLRNLKNTLDHLDLTSADTTPATIFGNLHNLVLRLCRPKSIEAGISISESGLPVVVPKVEFGDEIEEGTEVYSDDFLKTLHNAASSTDLQYWVLFDRLDEAFQEDPKVEVPALRALFRAYLDLFEFESFRLKLFVRRDLFRRIIVGGFVNLTHINARKIEILWDEDDLVDMLVSRVKDSDKLVEVCGLENKRNDEIFDIVFPAQVDVGERKPSTKTWMMSRISDGNGVRAPRNLIDLVNKAKENQNRKDVREPRDLDSLKGPLIESSSIKKAISQLSEQRVQDTLLAEAYNFSAAIEAFRSGKSEHSHNTLKRLLEPHGEYEHLLRGLVEMGFLEKFGASFKVPMLYRDGLKITQGKAS